MDGKAPHYYINLKNTTMNYSFYLFSQLFDVYHTTDATYDEKFKEISAMYQDYLKSGYNNPNYGEYECISAYLSEHLPSI